MSHNTSLAASDNAEYSRADLQQPSLLKSNFTLLATVNVVASQNLLNVSSCYAWHSHGYCIICFFNPTLKRASGDLIVIGIVSRLPQNSLHHPRLWRRRHTTLQLSLHAEFWSTTDDGQHFIFEQDPGIRFRFDFGQHRSFHSNYTLIWW